MGAALAISLVLLSGCSKEVPKEARFCSDVLGANDWPNSRIGLPYITDFKGPTATGEPTVFRVELTYHLETNPADDTAICDIFVDPHLAPADRKLGLVGYQFSRSTGYIKRHGQSGNIAVILHSGHFAWWRVDGYEESDPRLPETTLDN